MTAQSAPSDALVRSWLQQLTAEQRGIVEPLRRLILEATDGAHEIVYHDALGYGPSTSAFDRIVYIATFASHVDLGFMYGAAVRDPSGLLRGTGKQMRHVKFSHPEDTLSMDVEPAIRYAWTDGLARVRERHKRSRPS